MKNLLLLMGLLVGLASPASAGVVCAPGHENDVKRIIFDVSEDDGIIVGNKLPAPDTPQQVAFKMAVLIDKLKHNHIKVSDENNIKFAGTALLEVDVPCKVVSHFEDMGITEFFWIDEPLYLQGR